MTKTSAIHEPYGLTPEDIGDRLSQSWIGDKRLSVLALDGSNERLSIKIEGQRDQADFWVQRRTLDISGRLLDAEHMFVDPNAQGNGIGRRFMLDAIDLASSLNLDKIQLETKHIGRYVWLRMGFVPDRGSWGTMRRAITSRLSHFFASGEIGHDRFLGILRLCQSPDPRMARVIASLPDPVSSQEIHRYGADVSIPLGKALLLESASDWFGELDLNDRDSVRMAKEYSGER